MIESSESHHAADDFDKVLTSSLSLRAHFVGVIGRMILAFVLTELQASCSSSRR